MVLICISLMSNGVEYLHVPVGHLYVSLEKCLFRYFANF